MATESRDRNDARAPEARDWRARLADALAFRPAEMIALACLGTLVLGGATLAYVRSRPVAAAGAPAVLASQSPSATGTGRLTVHVAGEVRRPGVYSFDEGARIVDAVRAAGGFTRKADRTAVNLARLLVDGEQILVPRRAPGGSAASTSTATGSTSDPININTATAAQLEELPGVGEVLAQRIIDYREQHGPFTKPEDLQNVSGIGPKTYEAIAPLITV
jgi:competence protein ComEA